MNNLIPASIQAQADAIMAARRGWSGGMTAMAVTKPTDIPDFIPELISTSFYDRMDEPSLALTRLSVRFPGQIEGRPGEKIRVVTDAATTPAENLAVDVPATDDSIGSDSWEFTVKEGVKSIAWYDRTQVQSGQNVSQLAGRKVGTAMEERVELDLAAALIAGRNVAADAAITGLDVAAIRAMKAQIPPRLKRGRRIVLVGSDAALETLFDDPLLSNAASFGSDEAIRNGALSRPIWGVEPVPVDDATLPETVTVAAGTGPLVAMFPVGVLGYGFQKNPRTETERDARARLTRIVGTMLHAEGVQESAGVVVRRITG